MHPRFGEAVRLLRPNDDTRGVLVDHGAAPAGVELKDGDGPFGIEVRWPAEWGDQPTDADCDAVLLTADWNAVRAVRAPLLAASDVVAVRCLKAGVPFPADWQAYTVALRDITLPPATPSTVVWPTVPAVPAGV